MSALASLLVRDQIVSVRKIEEAIQRQVISGGELDTVLLELGAVPENTIAAYRAVLYDLPPAMRDQVMQVEPDVVRRVPREVAERHRLVPMAAEGATLAVAVSKPIARTDVEQLGFLLHHTLALHIVPEARLQMALAHHYGVEMPPRMRRLQKKLDERDPGVVPEIAPPEDNRLDRTRMELPRREEVEKILSEPPPEPEGRTTQRFGTAAAPPAEETRPASPPETAAAPSPVTVGVSRVVGVGEERETAPLGHVPERPEPPAEPEPLLDASQAIERIDGAQSRDEILGAFFAFARGQLDYAALFAVHDDIAEGRNAAGEGASSEEVGRMAIPLDAAGSFADVRRSAGPKVTSMDGTEVDRKLIKELRRDGAQPSILIPVTIRQRPVLILYGDRGGREVGFSELSDLLALTTRVGNAFERLIVQRKFRGYASAQGKTGEGRLRPDQLSMPSRPARVSRASWEPAEPEGGGGGPAATAAAPPSRPPSSPAPDASPPQAAPRAAPAVRARRVRSARRTVMGLPAADLSSDSWDSGDRSAVSRPAGPRVQESAPPSSGEDRPEAFAVLGVPRSAPPPPDPSQAPSSAPAAEPAAGRDTLQDVPPAMPEPAAGEDDEPELIVEYGAQEDAELAALEDYATDEAPEPAAEAAAAPEPSGRGVRGDPRRDGPDEGPPHDVVRLGRAAAAAAASIARGSSQPPAPSQPPSDPDPGEPSVIVNMGGNVESLVRELMLSGPDDDATLTQRVLTQGEAVLPVLVQHFPGPLWFDRHRPHRRLPAGRDVSPIARAVAAFGDLAVPYIVSLLGSRNGDTRFYALLLAHDFLHPDLVEPVGAMVFDPDAGVRTVALRVLPRFPRGEAYDKLLESLRIFGRVPRKSPQARAQAVAALGPLHDVGALDLLIDLLEADEAPTVEAAHRSLVVLTRHDFGAAKRRWAAWADKNRHRHRIEWLIEALTLADQSLHSAAGNDLQQTTQQYFGYHPSMSKHEREVVQQRYWDWWQSEGRARFVDA